MTVSCAEVGVTSSLPGVTWTRLQHIPGLADIPRDDDSYSIALAATGFISLCHQSTLESCPNRWRAATTKPPSEPPSSPALFLRISEFYVANTDCADHFACIGSIHTCERNTTDMQMQDHVCAR